MTSTVIATMKRSHGVPMNVHLLVKAVRSSCFGKFIPRQFFHKGIQQR